MSTFVVSSAFYNSTPPNQKDALVFVQGTCDGAFCIANLWWSAIQTANIAGGQSGVQQLIGYWFKKYVETYPVIFNGQPKFPVASNIPAPAQGDGNSNNVCAVALVPSWSA